MITKRSSNSQLNERSKNRHDSPEDSVAKVGQERSFQECYLDVLFDVNRMLLDESFLSHLKWFRF